MGNILKKEFKLAMHPVTPLMIILAAMVLIPNYPYIVIFFYISLGIFFTCLLGRENNDVTYSLNLPISKADIVKGRILFAVIIEMIQMILMVPMAVLRQNLVAAGNQAGMDANITLFAEGFIIYGLYNLLFFTSYYKNVNKVGISFVKSSTMFFIAMIIDIVLCYGVPFVRDILDTPDPQYLTAKLTILAIGIVSYVALTVNAIRISINRFDREDLN